MKTRTHFGHRIDMLDREGEIVEHLAGVEDSLLADATYEAALRRWPKVAIILRQGARVIRDSRKPRLVKADSENPATRRPTGGVSGTPGPGAR